MKKVLIVLAVIVVLIAAFAAYAGVFAPVKISQTTSTTYFFAGKKMKGSYAQIGGTIDEVIKTLADAGIECDNAFGVYYNSPAEVAEEDLKWMVGGIIEGENLGKLQNAENLDLEKGTLPSVKALIATMPTKTAVSFMLHPWKVYPKMLEYMTEKGLKMEPPSYEIYKGPEKVTDYIMPYSAGVSE